MKDILFLILHTHKQQDRYKNVTETWGNDCDHLFYSDRESHENNILKVTDRDDYASNEVKFYEVIKNLPDKYSYFQWYFFCYNDTFINTNKFFESLELFDPKKVYGQKINTWTQDKNLHYLSGGAGYLVSNEIMKILKSNIKNYNTTFADVTMGLTLRDNNIEIENFYLFKSQPPKYYNIPDEQIKNYISFHYIKSYNEMNKLYQLREL